MQEMRRREDSPLEAGTIVEARRALWSVRATRRADRLTLVHLVARGARVPGTRALVSPFDRLTPHAPRLTAWVSRRAWMHSLRSHIAEVCPFDAPASAASANVTLVPFQLEPLLALRFGLATRVLVADEVGLGKTIQAALVARDLVDRHPETTVLIVTPAGLREQWQRELRVRTGLETTVAEAAWLRATEATLPRGVNAWRLARLVVVSIDFAKQPEILRTLQDVVWSLLIVDEAHLVAPGTERFDAVGSLAAHSERVMLLTATPHDGDEARFAALCELGRIDGDGPLAIFRRTRRALPPGMRLDIPPRRVSVRLRVRPSAAEARLHALLDRYVRCVWHDAPETTRTASRLAMSVLVKRAASSPWSLEQSLRRRRALMTTEAGAPAQSGLDFDDLADRIGRDLGDPDAADSAPDAVLGAAGLAPNRERTWLNLLINAASAASAGERKLAVLERLLRRTREPVIVFTEYRDTLARLAGHVSRQSTLTCLHGGLDAEARRHALGAFASGAARVLLSTDAASQGLNLQHRCRLVVHVELPWNPLRIEQRNGRVDRIGQPRAVHAVHLVGRDTAEERIEARLADRRRRIDAALERGFDEVAVLGLALLHPSDSSGTAGSNAQGAAEALDSSRGARSEDVLWPNLSLDAERTASWLEWLRSVRPHDAAVHAPDGALERTRLHPRAVRRLGLERGLLALHRTRLRDARGAIRETSLDVHHLPGAQGALESDPRSASVSQRIHSRAAERLETVRRAADRADEALERRRRAMHRLDLATRPPDQLDLFDEFAPPRPVASAARAGTGVGPGAADGVWSAEVDVVLVCELR